MLSGVGEPLSKETEVLALAPANALTYKDVLLSRLYLTPLRTDPDTFYITDTQGKHRAGFRRSMENPCTGDASDNNSSGRYLTFDVADAGWWPRGYKRYDQFTTRAPSSSLRPAQSVARKKRPFMCACFFFLCGKFGKRAETGRMASAVIVPPPADPPQRDLSEIALSLTKDVLGERRGQQVQSVMEIVTLILSHCRTRCTCIVPTRQTRA